MMSGTGENVQDEIEPAQEASEWTFIDDDATPLFHGTDSIRIEREASAAFGAGDLFGDLLVGRLVERGQCCLEIVLENVSICGRVDGYFCAAEFTLEGSRER